MSGCNGYYEFVFGAGAKTKSVTYNLPLLPMLAGGVVKSWEQCLRL